jgi:hypothetical protein
VGNIGGKVIHGRLPMSDRRLPCDLRLPRDLRVGKRETGSRGGALLSARAAGCQRQDPQRKWLSVA